MSAVTVGSFPVKTLLSRNVDESGVVVASARITTTSATAVSYLPSLHSAFEFDSSLWVTAAEVSYPQNDLAEISITASGPASTAAVRVHLVPGAPLIFGLAPGVPSQISGIPRWSNDGGLAVHVDFVATADQENSIFSQYVKQAMPGSVRGRLLPRAARLPGPIGDTFNSGDGIGVPVPLVPPSLPSDSTSTASTLLGYRDWEIGRAHV